MEIKRQVTSVSYRIGRKPEGGFIARSADPAVPPIEAATQEELSQKIRAAAFGPALAGLKLPGMNGLSVLLNRVESVGPSAVITTKSGETHTPSQEEIDQFANLVGKNFPQLSQALAARAGKAETALNSNQTTVLDGQPAKLNGTGSPVSNAPIAPEASGGWKILGALLAAFVLGALMYFFFRH